MPIIPSPKHTQCKSPHPTRATHCYTTEGLIISEPNSLEKSRSIESSVELSFETFGKDKKRLKTAAPLVEQMALCKQQSLTKTLDLQPKTYYSSDENDDPPKLPPRSNETLDISIPNVPPKLHHTCLNDKLTMSLPSNFQKQNKSNPTYEICENSQTKKSIFFPQNQLPDPQPFFNEIKSTNYRENYVPFQNPRFPIQQHNFATDFNLQNFASQIPRQKIPFISQYTRATNITQTTKYPQQQHRLFQPSTTIETPPKPPPRPINLTKYPTNFDKHHQPTITNFPTSHWV